MTARSDKNTNSCPKTCNKTVTGYIFYHTSKILQTRKLEKSIFSMLFLKTFKHEAWTVCKYCNIVAANFQVRRRSKVITRGYIHQLCPAPAALRMRNTVNRLNPDNNHYRMSIAVSTLHQLGTQYDRALPWKLIFSTGATLLSTVARCFVLTRSKL